MKAVNFLFFLILLGIGEFVAVVVTAISPPLGGIVGVGAFFFALLVSMAIKIADQWKRIIILRLGKFSSIKGPGICLVIPVIDRAIFVDTRILTLDIPKQQVITKDNVPVSINGVVYYRVIKTEDAIIKVQNYNYAMSQYALAALRDVVGTMTLDQLLSEREQIGKEIEAIVEKESQNWGLEVTT